MSSRCRVALLGFGTVGSAVARRFASSDSFFTNIQLTHIFDRRADEKRASLKVEPIAWTSSIDDVLQSDADVVVEAIGGLAPAADWIRAALLAGKSVVTANKQVIARHGADLQRLAESQGRQLRFEGAVGGVMPIVRAIGDGLAGDRITRIIAILNGTTNAVLSSIESSGCAIDEAVLEARKHGYAEIDVSADLDGHDAGAKLAILCGLAFGLRVDPSQIGVRTTAAVGASDFARAKTRGATIRQIACACYDRAASTLTAWVAPIEVDCASIFARAKGPQNAALITGEHGGEIGMFGAGAGGDATAVSVLSDVAAIARDKAAVVPAPSLTRNFRFQIADFRIESCAMLEAS